MGKNEEIKKKNKIIVPIVYIEYSKVYNEKKNNMKIIWKWEEWLYVRKYREMFNKNKCKEYDGRQEIAPPPYF